MGKKALVIIDVQNGMFGNPGYDPHDGEQVIAHHNHTLGSGSFADLQLAREVFVKAE